MCDNLVSVFLTTLGVGTWRDILHMLKLALFDWSYVHYLGDVGR
jgi:hypothetical protein